jgi:transcription elongation factor GreA
VSDKIPMTVLGHQKLKEELKHLKTVERPAISKAIEIARGHGDLSENADYSAAKEKQGFIEGRILEIESKLAMSEIIDPSKLSGERVVFGATVGMTDAESGEEVNYQIVGVDEADLKEGKVSITSPIARAMIGKRVGDEVVVRTPKGGGRSYEITEIRFV